MTAAARRKTFFQEIQVLRRQQGHLAPTEIARLALKVGLSACDTLLELQDHYGYRHRRSGEIVEALALFVSSLCEQSKAKRVLEYFSMPSLLTGRLAENGEKHQLTYIAPDQHVAETLRVFFDEKSPSVIRSISDIPNGADFDVIICQPPVGHRPSESKTIDGFGGEVVRELVPFLAESGTLYWVTGRGILFTLRAKKTLADLQKDGLHTLAAIDVAPGAFLGTLEHRSSIHAACCFRSGRLANTCKL